MKLLTKVMGSRLVILASLALLALTPLTVLADSGIVDSDLATMGLDNTVNLSAVANSMVTTMAQVAIRYQGNNHVAAGTAVKFVVDSKATNLPSGYSVGSTTVNIATSWNDSSQAPAGIASISFTAPADAGTYPYTVKWNTGDIDYKNQLTGMPALTINLTVTTPPMSADSSAPVIEPTVIGSLGDNGWYTSNVSVSWSVTDAESGVTLLSGCGTITIDSDIAGTTLTCSATSAGGTGSNSVTIKRDATPPTITANVTPDKPGSTDWYNLNTGAPTVSFTCTDNGSGLAGLCPSKTFGEGANQSYSQTISDLAGNSTTASGSGINVDLTLPSLNISGAAAGAYSERLALAHTPTRPLPLMERATRTAKHEPSR